MKIGLLKKNMGMPIKKAIDRFAIEKILTVEKISLMMFKLWRINEYT